MILVDNGIRVIGYLFVIMSLYYTVLYYEYFLFFKVEGIFISLWVKIVSVGVGVCIVEIFIFFLDIIKVRL